MNKLVSKIYKVKVISDPSIYLFNFNNNYDWYAARYVIQIKQIAKFYQVENGGRIAWVCKIKLYGIGSKYMRPMLWIFEDHFEDNIRIPSIRNDSKFNPWKYTGKIVPTNSMITERIGNILYESSEWIEDGVYWFNLIK